LLRLKIYFEHLQKLAIFVEKGDRIFCSFNCYCINGDLRAKPLAAGGKGVWGQISQCSIDYRIFFAKRKNALLDISQWKFSPKPAKIFYSLLGVLKGY